jgi:hypothetical protein
MSAEPPGNELQAPETQPQKVPSPANPKAHRT